MIYSDDTIVAISTGTASNSGIGIIRMSGNEAISIADKIFKGKNNNVSSYKSHTVHYGRIHDNGTDIDEVLLIVMKGPNTYTREDIIEIDCHGGVMVMNKILEICVKNGARIAQPGEFTKRAFLNGRIDLSQAEAVIDIINSKNELSLKSSYNVLSGHLTERIKGLRETIINRVAFIEAALDDPEHYSLDTFDEENRDIFNDIIDKLQYLISSFDNGKIIKDGINTVILGKPNAGKSSLLNALARYDRAIVTDIPGTTRDIIEEQININGILLNLIDTAGIRDTEDIVESIGVDKAKECAQNADLIIYVVDSSIPLDNNDIDIINIIKDKKVIIILNKSDLTNVIKNEDILKYIKAPVINLSAKTSYGIDSLENSIRDMFFNGYIEGNDELLITNLRHKNALVDAYNSMKLVIDSMDNMMPQDFYSIDLLNAYESLGLIIGEAVEEDLVNEIFEKFCMGK